ncbi:MAG: undecaprenyl-diphosphate phosphatase [Myxococcota bacterium]
MNWLEALWLGIVQGLTEFLPVSSSGHLVIFQTLLGAEAEGGILFEIAVHVATLVAIAVFYRRRILELVVGAFRGHGDAWRYGAKLGVATLPAVAVGLLAKDWVEAHFHAPAVSGVGLLLTGTILWTTRSTLSRAQGEEPGWAAALLIGCAQAFAIWPGVSRSGTTVAAALALGVRPERAAEFSFLMGIIAIAGAAVLAIPDLGEASSGALAAISIGGAAALVSGVAAIWLFIRLLRAKIFHAFSYYAWATGLAFLAWIACTG